MFLFIITITIIIIITFISKFALFLFLFITGLFFPGTAGGSPARAQNTEPISWDCDFLTIRNEIIGELEHLGICSCVRAPLNWKVAMNGLWRD